MLAGGRAVPVGGATAPATALHPASGRLINTARRKNREDNALLFIWLRCVLDIDKI